MATLPTPSTELSLEQLYLAYLPHIERAARYVCRRYHFSQEGTEEFVSVIRTKIFDYDYAVLRKFQGKSTLETYLTVVVRRGFKDHLNHLWGKWRPSAEAERLGPLAIQLDRLLNRDGCSFEEACQILRTNHHVEASPQELEELAVKLPQRNPPPQVEGEEALGNRPAQDMAPDERLVAKETARRFGEIVQLLKQALRRLSPEDALIAQMSCEFKISQIARKLRLDQKPLYRRRETILKTLRQDLESHGVQPDEVGGLLSIPEDDHEPRD